MIMTKTERAAFKQILTTTHLCALTRSLPSLNRTAVSFLLSALVLLTIAFQSQGQIRDGGVDPWNLGKGDWIYSITDATNKVGGHVNSVTNENSLMLYYKTQGIRYMVVKAGN